MRLLLSTIVVLLLMYVTPLCAESPAGANQAGLATARAAQSQLYLYGAAIAGAPQEDNLGVLYNENIRIINLGPIVNYEGLDYAPTISADGKTLYFVSDREGSVLDKDENPSHDFWFTTKPDNYDTVFAKPVNLDPNSPYGRQGTNTPRNEGVASISADQQMLVFTGCDREDGIGGCDLYISEINEDGTWGLPKNLGRTVNSEAWDSQPSIAPDKSRIYFASNRDGGVGGMDIWYTDFDFEFEEWQEAVNLGEEINTDEDDWSPFINADNETLFISSKGHKPNIGGFDFYISRRNQSGAWSAPENIGQPINTQQDEFFISAPASGDILYFASRRQDISGFQGDYDIFMAFVPTFFRTQLLTVQVLDECTGESIPATVEVVNTVTRDRKSGDIAGDGGDYRQQINPLDFGDAKDSILQVSFEISASNPAYGTVSTKLVVDKPAKVEDKDEASKTIQLDPVVIRLGQRPKLRAEMDFSDYSKDNPNDPDFGKFKGLVMQEIQTRTLYPLLNYIFFDEGGSDIPERYILFDSPSQVGAFDDNNIPGGTFEKYYNILNIYGYRMKKNPSAKLQVVGYIGTVSPKEQDGKIAETRAKNVYNYLKDVWGIEESRLDLKWGEKPQLPSNVRDSMGQQENRRVELLSTDWEVVKPIIDTDPTLFPSPETMTFVMENGIDDNIVAERRIEVTHGDKPWNTLKDIGTTDASFEWDWFDSNDLLPKKGDESAFQARLVVTSKNGRECISDPITILVKQISTRDDLVGDDGDKTLEKYNLVLFKFNSDEAGVLNERILKEFVFDRVLPSSEVNIVGHTDVVGLYEVNQRLSQRRAATVERSIKANRKKFKTFETDGVGEDDALYTNESPEGRFYNRTVQIQIQTPLSAFKNN